MTRAAYVLIVFIALAAALAAAPPCMAQEELLLGMSADFNGPAGELGVDLYRGSVLYFNHVNDQGGVHGRTIRIVALDDGYNPDPAIANTVRLVERHDVFALFDYVGTPTTTRILPLLKRYAKRHLYLLFPLTGAEPPRQPPYGRYVFNLRASYADEATVIVDRFVSVDRPRIAIFYQVDSFGRSAWNGVRKALTEHGLPIAAEATYRRGATFESDMRAQVDVIARGKPDAVIVAATSEACAAFVRDARDAGLSVPIASLSFASAREVMTQLLALGDARYTEGFIGSKVVPCHKDHDPPAVREFKRLLAERPPEMPEGLIKRPLPAPSFTPVAFEGFLNAKLVVEALRRLGPMPRRDRLPYALRMTGPFDLGLEAPVQFEPSGNQALTDVYFVVIDGDDLKALPDFERWRP